MNNIMNHDNLIYKLATSNLDVIKQLNAVEDERNMLEASVQEFLDELDAKDRMINSLLQQYLKSSYNRVDQETVTDVNCKTFEDDINYYRNRLLNVQTMFEETKTRIYDISTENADLKNNINLKDDEMLSLTEKHVALLEQAQTNHEKYQQSLQAMKLSQEKLEIELRSKEDGLKRLQTSVDSLMASKAQMKILIDEKDSENIHLNQIIDNMSKTIEDLNLMIEEKDVEITELTQRCDDFDKERMELDESMMDELIKISTKANIVRDELEKQIKEKDAIIQQIIP